MTQKTSENHMNEPQTIQIAKLKTNGGTQVRAALNEDHVRDLVEAIEGGADLPPIVVMYDGTDRFLVDGFHRVEAFRRLGREEIPAVFAAGSHAEAVLAACAANKEHRGLKRTNVDKRRAVETCLRVLAEMGESWSDRRIADHCEVDGKTVAALRATAELPQFTAPRVGADGKARKMPAPRAPKPTPVVDEPPPVSVYEEAAAEVGPADDDPPATRSRVLVRATEDDDAEMEWRNLPDGIRFVRAVELAKRLGQPGADGAVFVRGDEAVIIVGKGWRDFVEFFGWK